MTYSEDEAGVIEVGGSLEYEITDTTSTQHKIKTIKGVTGKTIPAEQWVDKEELEKDSEIDPWKVLLWILKKIGPS